MNMKESEVPKFLAEVLSKEPFNLNLNLISFTSLKGDSLMKIFQSVLVEIQPKLKDEFEHATQNDKINTMVELLRVLQFWPKCFEQQTVRQALETVNQEIVWDTMGWILTRIEDLKKRAYLSQFLVKVSVPDEYKLDSEIQQCYEEYESKMEEFKVVHKKLGEIKRNKGVAELVQDLKAVEHEIDSCSRKLDIMKCNMGEMPEKELLQLAAELREARNDKIRLGSQIYTEERKLWSLDKKAYFLSNRVHELQEMNSHSSPEGLLERTEQDCEILKFIVHHKIPQDIDDTKRKIRSMQIAITSAPEYPSDLEPTRMKIYSLQKEIQNIEMEIKSKDSDVSLTFARQKASQNKKKKLELLEELEEIRKDMLEHQNTLREKREERKRHFPGGIPCLSTRDYKEYVKTMKVKAAKYKSMQAEIATIQTEIGVLTTTKNIVEHEFKDSIENLKQLEEKLGLVGFSCFHERAEQEQSRQNTHEGNKIRHIYELSEKARELQERVKMKKSEIEPLSRGVIDAKQELKSLELQKKCLSNAFEAEMGPVTESIRRLDERTQKVKEEIIRTQEDISRVSVELPVMKASLQRAADEENLIKTNPSNCRSFKNRTLTRIVDQERLQKSLNEEMSHLEQFQAHATSQHEMWRNLKKVIDLKISALRCPSSVQDQDFGSS